MPPGLGVIVFIGAGYLLVYAAVANAGRFSTAPWAGLMEDAYTGSRSTAGFGRAIPMGKYEKAAHSEKNSDVIRPRQPRQVTV